LVVSATKRGPRPTKAPLLEGEKQMDPFQKPTARRRGAVAQLGVVLKRAFYWATEASRGGVITPGVARGGMLAVKPPCCEHQNAAASCC